MVSILPLIFNPASFLSKPLRTIPKAPTTIGIIVTLMFTVIFVDTWQIPSTCLSVRFLLFSFYSPLNIITLLREFFTSVLFDCFSLGPKRQQVSAGLQTLLSILVNFSGTVVWIVSILPQISSSSRLFFRSLEFIPKTPTTIGITITFIFHNLFKIQVSV